MTDKVGPAEAEPASEVPGWFYIEGEGARCRWVYASGKKAAEAVCELAGVSGVKIGIPAKGMRKKPRAGELAVYEITGPDGVRRYEVR
jgi:hypothetical protein